MTAQTSTAVGRAQRAQDEAFYQGWSKFLDWMKAYAEENAQAIFEKEADFPDFIYRMERAYDLPTIIMSASISDTQGHPILLASVSPRHAVFRELHLHPFESHVYRTLTYDREQHTFVEGKRAFSKEMLFKLADDLFETVSHE